MPWISKNLGSSLHNDDMFWVYIKIRVDFTNRGRHTCCATFDSKNHDPFMEIAPQPENLCVRLCANNSYCLWSVRNVSYLLFSQLIVNSASLRKVTHHVPTQLQGMENNE